MKILAIIIVITMLVINSQQIFIVYALMQKFRDVWDSFKCAKDGGKWERDGLGAFYRCSKYYKDGGQVCKSSD